LTTNIFWVKWIPGDPQKRAPFTTIKSRNSVKKLYFWTLQKTKDSAVLFFWFLKHSFFIFFDQVTPPWSCKWCPFLGHPVWSDYMAQRSIDSIHNDNMDYNSQKTKTTKTKLALFIFLRIDARLRSLLVLLNYTHDTIYYFSNIK